MTTAAVQKLQADRATASAFLDLMAEGEPVTFQTFDDDSGRKAGKFARHFTADLDDAFARLSQLNAQGAGIFWMVNYGDGKGRSSANVTGVRAVFVDLDGHPLGPVQSCGVEPHAVIESSPRRWHAYWLVQGATLPQFESVQRALAAKFGGDISVCDLPRVMRVPGFWHQKGAPFQTRIVSLNKVQPYELDNLVARLSLDLAPRQAPIPTSKASAGDNKIPPGGRHKHLESLFGTLNRKGATLATISAALEAENQSRCDPPLDSGDVARLAADMLKRYSAQHGEAQAAKNARAADEVHKGRQSPNRLEERSYDLAELLATPMAEPSYVAGALVPEGVVLWCGRPKLGKTTALRQLAHACNVGGTFLEEQCVRCEVWFLSLEEGERLFRKKVAMMGLPIDELRGIQMDFAWPQGAPGVEKLRQRLKERGTGLPVLIIIDSLQRFRLPQSDRGHAFTEDYNAIKLLADLCKEFPGLSIVVLHHTTKAVPDDPVAAISGTYGLTAAADSYAIMLKQASRFRLHAGGRLWDRDASDFELRRASGGWVMAGEWDTSAPQGLTPKQQQIVAALRDGAKSNRVLADATGQSASALSHMMAVLEGRGLVTRIANGWGLST